VTALSKNPSVIVGDVDHCHSIQIFDNVFSKETCRTILHELAQDHSERHVSSIFRQSSVVTSSQLCELTPLERTLNHLLTTFLQETPIESSSSCNSSSSSIPEDMYVEYWSRQDYINLDTHCDIDERLLDYNTINNNEEEVEEDKNKKNILRYPYFSHILYLKVTVSKGPTCIWEEEKEQWSNHDSNNLSDTCTGSNAKSSNHVPLLTIPAVEGRLVRFPGNRFHAVPKPYDRWIISPKKEQINSQSTPCDDYDDDEYIYDDDDDEDNTEIRSVLLFNTWKVEDGPPLDVQPDRQLHIPDGVTFDDNDDDSQLSQSSTTCDDSSEYNDNIIRCRPKADWIQCSIHNDLFIPPTSSTVETIQVPLLGNQNRHGYPKSRITLLANIPTLRKALEQTHIVSRVNLYRTKKWN
jgi:hypothetical protein